MVVEEVGWNRSELDSSMKLAWLSRSWEHAWVAQSASKLNESLLWYKFSICCQWHSECSRRPELVRTAGKQGNTLSPQSRIPMNTVWTWKCRPKPFNSRNSHNEPCYWWRLHNAHKVMGDMIEKEMQEMQTVRNFRGIHRLLLLMKAATIEQLNRFQARTMLGNKQPRYIDVIPSGAVNQPWIWPLTNPDLQFREMLHSYKR